MQAFCRVCVFDKEITLMFCESKKVFCACAIGAGIGAFVALQLSVFFCWVGFLLGGLIGYLSYEWKAVIQAIPRALRATINYRLPKEFWKISWGLLFCFFAVLVLVANMLSWLVVGAGSVKLYCVLFGPLGDFWIAILSIATVLPFAIFGVGSLLIGLEDRLTVQKLTKWLYRVSVPTVLFWHLPRITASYIWFGIRKSPKVLLVSCLLPLFLIYLALVFLKNLLLLIHSQLRLLCGVDAMIGAMIGRFYGVGMEGVLLGMLAGGFFGLFNYVVVTELCLKKLGLIPNQG